MATEPLVVRDLDALVSEPVGFRFNGQVHTIKPIEAGELLILHEKFAQIQRLAEQKDVTADELVDLYVEVFTSLSPTLTRADVEKMTQRQLTALFTLALDSVTGKVFSEVADRGEKKTPEIQTAPTPASSPSTPPSS